MLSNTGPFANLQPHVYWFGVAYAPSPAYLAWDFYTYYGQQSGDVLEGGAYAWAVRPGDVPGVTPVPEPQTYLLMLLGLSAITVAARRRQST